MNNMPRTFCITLSETAARKERAKQYFDNINLKVEFFEGIHAEKFGIKSSSENECPITQGALGCTLSHIMLWKLLQFLPDSEFLILEDDVKFVNGFNDKFNEYYVNLPKDWQVAYLGYTEWEGCEPIKISEHISTYKPYGTFAYMVKKEALPILIATNKQSRIPIDVQIREVSLFGLTHYVTQLTIDDSQETSDPTIYSLCYDWKNDPQNRRNGNFSNILSFGNGWYPLEHNESGDFVWTDGSSKLFITSGWNTLDMDVIVDNPLLEFCEISQNSELAVKFKLISGYNKITINLSPETSFIVFDTVTFNPSLSGKSLDTRDLGIRILNSIVVSNDILTKKINISNIKKFKKIGMDVGENDYALLSNDFFENNPGGKLKLINQWGFAAHRSGWNYALQSIAPLHNDNGIKFDGTLDATFGHFGDENERICNIPYKMPWVGVFHVPPQISSFYDQRDTPASAILNIKFQESLETCRGIYVLSEYHARFLRTLTSNIMVEVLYHPTEFPSVKFNYNDFIDNENKKIVNVGSWLRKLSSIYKVKVDTEKYKKINLYPNQSNKQSLLHTRIFKIETSCFSSLSDEELNSVSFLNYLSNAEYDILLSKNIIFIDLYDASANNVVIECMVRATPLLINPLPAVIEYLGMDYPFYFTSIEEASYKAQDMDLIRRTHEYLLDWKNVSLLTKEHFIKSLAGGNIYKSI